MQITTLIKKLERLHEQKGDIEVMMLEELGAPVPKQIHLAEGSYRKHSVALIIGEDERVHVGRWQ